MAFKKARATRRRKVAPAKKTTSKRRRSPVRAVARKVKRRYSSKTAAGRKLTVKNLVLDAGAMVGGFVLAGVAGQVMASQNMDSKIAAIIPAAAGAFIALKVKNPALKIAGMSMVAAAGVNVVNTMMKNSAGAPLSGDDLDALDVYSNQYLLGAPAQFGGVQQFGNAVDFSGDANGYSSDDAYPDLM